MRSPLTCRPSAACAPARLVTCALVALFASSVARGGEAKEAEVRERVRALVRELKDKDPKVRRRAASALSEIGPAAREALPALIKIGLKVGYGPGSVLYYLGAIDPVAKERVELALQEGPWEAGAGIGYSFEDEQAGLRLGLQLTFREDLQKLIDVFVAEVEIVEDGSVPCFRVGGMLPVAPAGYAEISFYFAPIDVRRNLRIEHDLAWSADLGLFAEEIPKVQLGYKQVDYVNADTFHGLHVTSPAFPLEAALLGYKPLGPALVAGGEADICIGGSDGFAFQSDMEGYLELRFSKPGEKTRPRASVRAGVRAAWDSGNDTFEYDPYVRAGLSLAF